MRAPSAHHPPASSPSDLTARPHARRYAEAFEDGGWDDLDFMGSCGEDMARSIAQGVGMKPGHLAKFLKLMPEYVASNTSA